MKIRWKTWKWDEILQQFFNSSLKIKEIMKESWKSHETKSRLVRNNFRKKYWKNSLKTNKDWKKCRFSMGQKMWTFQSRKLTELDWSLLMLMPVWSLSGWLPFHQRRVVRRVRNAVMVMQPAVTEQMRHAKRKKWETFCGCPDWTVYNATWEVSWGYTLDVEFWRGTGRDTYPSSMGL